MTANTSVRRVAIAVIRQDLRVHDNAVLLGAHKAGTHLLPIYVYDERHIELSGLPNFVRRGPEARTRICKFWRTSVFRAKFMTEGIYDLKDRLKARNSDLLVRFGRLEEIVDEVVGTLKQGGDKVEGVWLQKDYCVEELTIENKLTKSLAKHGVKLNLPDVQTLIDIQDLPFPVEKTPDVFTPFRKKVEALGRLGRPPLSMPDKFNPFPCPPSPAKVYPGYGAHFDNSGPDEILPGLLAPLKDSYSSKYADPATPTDPRSAFPFKGGETAALARLNWYFREGSPPPAHHYKETRNGMVGHEYSTKTSPFLCLGMLSPREIIQALEDHEKVWGETQSTYWVRFEILWRDFFILLARKFGSRLFRLEGYEGATDPKQAAHKVEPGWWKGYNEDGSLDDRTRAWFAGQTGVPFIDANQAELRESGFMSNRGRQNVASFLTKDLQVDWRIGAEFFEGHLVDYETAVNWGNWQYVAGCGNDPRASRQFNPIKQANDYDPHGTYTRQWLPQLAKFPTNKLQHPWTVPPAERARYISKSAEPYPEQPIIEPASWKPHYQRKSQANKTNGNPNERVKDRPKTGGGGGGGGGRGGGGGGGGQWRNKGAQSVGVQAGGN